MRTYRYNLVGMRTSSANESVSYPTTGRTVGLSENLRHKTSSGDWISSDAFAERHGLSRRAASRILAHAGRGRLWRGLHLQVRQRRGRGGSSGFLYEVLDVAPHSSDVADATAPEAPAQAQEERIEQRFAAIAPALLHPRGSAARAQGLRAAAADGEQNLRTLQRWMARYEARGVGGLANVRPRNAGHRRVVVSRAFDQAALRANLDPLQLGEIGQELERSLKGLWASRAETAGWREIRRLAEMLLSEACTARAISLPPEAFRLSRRRVEAFASFRIVNQRRNDRKAFDDAKPRIRRDWTGLVPMERVIADVKHVDVIVRRADGTLAWPKIVAFLDAGTNRIFVHPVLLDQGEGVRQEHVIEAFLAMVCDRDWGFPKGLYLDNGVEFAALTKIQGALGTINELGARTIIFAQPYNASAKPIESMFARLDRYVFSLLPGYAGPNRMAKKTQRVGKAPEAFDGAWDEFCAVVTGLIVDHNTRPIGGLWRDRSPRDWLEGKRADGWRPVGVDPVVLDAAFCDHDSRRVDRGVLKIGGRRYRHTLVSALPGRTVVDIALPWRRGANPLANVLGKRWVRLIPDIPYPAQWTEGARETGRRQKVQARYVAQLAREAPPLDPIQIKLRAAAKTIIQPPADTRLSGLDLGAQVQQLADALRAQPPSPTEEPPAHERRRLREMALTERLERRRRGDG